MTAVEDFTIGTLLDWLNSGLGTPPACKHENKLKKYLDNFRRIDYLKTMKNIITAIEDNLTLIILAVFGFAMFGLFSAFCEYVERNGL